MSARPVALAARATAGAVPGSIIAAIIVSHVAAKVAGAPSSIALVLVMGYLEALDGVSTRNSSARVNVLTAENSGRVDVAGIVGSKAMAMYIYDIGPGSGACPYHYEHVEEWLLVVDGAVTVRTPDGELTLERGELACFPAGPDGAHKVMNRSDAPARCLMFSQLRTPAVSVYPDSDKVGIWTSDDDPGMFFERGTAVTWGHGEEGWDRAD